jgi:hypothetical protein
MISDYLLLSLCAHKIVRTVAVRIRRGRHKPTVHEPDHRIDEDHNMLSAFHPLNSMGTHVIAAVMHNGID